MNIEDVKLKALANLPYFVDETPVYPVSLKRIIEIGYEEYNQYLSVVVLKNEQLIDEAYLDKIPKETSILNIVEMFGQDTQLFHQFVNAIGFLIGTKNIKLQNGLFIDGIEITSHQFENIVKVIRIQNGISNDEKQDFKPLNDGAKRLQQRILEKRKRVQELKNSSSDSSEALSFRDLVSILSSNANGINILNVFELNMFQFNDQFNRMKLLNDYDISIQSLLHGADPKKIEIKHWMSKS